MFLKEEQISEQSIRKLVGKPLEFDLKKPKSIGSAGFFLKAFKSKNRETDSLKINAKCNIEKRSKGLLLRLNYSNNLTVIPIPYEQIVSITLRRGEERIHPIIMSPMWILLKMGVSVLIARYFRFRLYEYSIDRVLLILKTNDYEMEFIANGYLFEGQSRFFENLDYGGKLKIERP